ncbi:unnamed protein product [Mesocestoides corti]|uniref:Uncharacterized protein n=1 Tax=Mesocestoides corti TaxID=53468 RepID=A0A0R3U1A1_MESCO|nr:unnamed protein product [Mesocestoides corti]
MAFLRFRDSGEVVKTFDCAYLSPKDCCRRICHPHLYRRAERLPSGYVEFHMPSGSLLSPDLEEADNPPASSLLSQSQECERSDFPIGGEATEEDDDDLLVM